MATKRNAAKSRPANGMPKEEACQILQVAPNATGELITQAYGHLVRKHLTSGDAQAARRLDELHQAYLVLHPGEEESVRLAALPSQAPAPPPAPAPEAEPISFGEFFSEVGRLVGRISARWRGRVVEVAILGGTTAWLGFLALSAGANPLWTVLALAIAAAAISAPWRRV